MTDSHHGLTRRQLLKRGAALGGAVAWATPVVQVVGMRAAGAQETSDPCATYCIKLVTADAYRGDGQWDEGAWVAFKTPANNCLVCPDGVPLTMDPPALLAAQILVEGDPATGVTVTIPANCELVAPGDPSPDELVNGSAAARCGNSGINGCTFAGPSDVKDGTLFLDVCPNDGPITQIELVIRCCG